MKFVVLLPCLVTAAWQPVCAQETVSQRIPASPVSGTRLDTPIVVGTFVPPHPVEPKKIPAMRIESSLTTLVEGKRTTVLRGEPSMLPDISRSAAPDPSTPEQVAAQQARASVRPRNVVVQMRAIVYDHKVSKVRWDHPQHPEIDYEAVVGLDFELFSSVANFTHKEVPHSLMLSCSDYSAEVRRLRGGDLEIPQMEAGAWRIIKGNSADPAGIAPFTALMDLYASEKNRMIETHSALKEYRAAAEAYRKANPLAEPMQQTFWLRPHRGSRYLQAEGGGR